MSWIWRAIARRSAPGGAGGRADQADGTRRPSPCRWLGRREPGHYTPLGVSKSAEVRCPPTRAPSRRSGRRRALLSGPAAGEGAEQRVGREEGNGDGRVGRRSGAEAAGVEMRGPGTDGGVIGVAMRLDRGDGAEHGPIGGVRVHGCPPTVTRTGEVCGEWGVGQAVVRDGSAATGETHRNRLGRHCHQQHSTSGRGFAAGVTISS